MSTPCRLGIKMEFLCEIPYEKYGRLVGICNWHDQIFVATEYGGIVRLLVHEDGSGASVFPVKI